MAAEQRRDRSAWCQWIDQRLRLSGLDFPVPSHSTHLFYALGGIAFLGFLILIGTGTLMLPFFNPNPDRAHRAVQALMTEIPGGRFIRSLHYWTAQGMVLAICVHLIRVFVTGAYKYPRAATWYLGVGLFFTVVMGSYFSGTVIKGDQESLEAMEHYNYVVDMLGPFGYAFSEHLTGSISMPLRMFTVHISLAPLAVILLVAGHFYLIHVFNLSPLPKGEQAALAELPPAQLTESFMAHAMSILKFGLIYYGMVAVLAIVVPAPVGEAQTAVMTGIKPPWPYLWLYGAENLLGMAGIFYGNMVLLILLLLVPLVDRSRSRAFGQRKGILAAGLVVLAVIVGLSLYAWLSPPEVHKGMNMGHQHEAGEPSSEQGGEHAHDEAMPPMPGMEGTGGMPGGEAGGSSSADHEPDEQAHDHDEGMMEPHQH
jgi:ubiquinol-cytochrome c reductase cytochrome b subunit